MSQERQKGIPKGRRGPFFMGQTPAEDLTIPDKWNIARFRKLGRFICTWLDRPLVEDQVTVLDIACGFGEPGKGIVEGIVGQEKMGRYIGFDKARYTPTYYDPDCQLYYGPEWDATSLETWKWIEQEIQPHVLLLRQPDVRGNTEVFSQIIDNTVSYAVAHTISLWITTSNEESEQKIYEMLEHAMINIGGQEDPAQEVEHVKRYYGSPITYQCSDGKRWRVNAYSTRSTLGRPIGADYMQDQYLLVVQCEG